MLSGRMEYRSSSVNRSMAICCAQSEVKVKSNPPPRIVPTTLVIPLGKRYCGVTLAGALGFSFSPVNPLSHAVANRANTSTGVARAIVLSLMLVPLSRSGGRSRCDVDHEAEAARGGELPELESLCVAVVERRLGIDVGYLRVQPQVAADKGEVERRDADPVAHRCRGRIAELHLTQLHEAGVVDVRLVDLEERVEVGLRRHLGGVRRAVRVYPGHDHAATIRDRLCRLAPLER